MSDIDETVKEFLTESAENLDRLDQDFVALEKDPSASERLASIFRTIHTIKGTCGFLGFGKLEAVAHAGESLLSRIREGQLIIDSDRTTALLMLVDAIREILRAIETTGNEGGGDYSSITQTLVRLNESPTETKHTARAAAAPPAAVAESAGPATFEQDPTAKPEEEVAVADLAQGDAPQIDSGDLSFKERRADSVAANAIRVDVVLLDKLMNLVGELVLARNQILQFTGFQNHASLLRTAQRLNLITTELQEGVMKTRMQPIGNLWSKFPRVVRDIATVCGKKVRIEMDGRDTELDKTILEAIKDPLTHVIRNSVDHGIEDPAKRVAAGKTEEGRLFLRAFHEGGQVNIEISDDGKGIDPELVKRKAVERGLITIDQAARMEAHQAIALVFLPGFSTAEKVTNLSGRGVGMDVVKTNIEKIGGTVDIASRVGAGTTLRIKIPLTLAIIPALVVTSGGERYAIPQTSLLELVRVGENDAGIESIDGHRLYRLRGNLLSLVFLDSELKIEKRREAGAQAATNIVVLRSGDRQFGLVVDQINDTEEIVVKPLGKQLKGISAYAGATIMGDGKVALILDVPGLAHKSNALLQNNKENSARTAVAQSRQEVGDHQMLLVFELEGDQRMAMPLALVTRLEEFGREKVQDAGGQRVVQYRDQIMPLVNPAEMLRDRRGLLRARRGPKEQSAEETLQVIVYTYQNRNVGLQVQRIVDVVEERLNLQRAGTRPGVLGTAIIKDKVIGLLDVDTVVRAAIEPAEIGARGRGKAA